MRKRLLWSLGASGLMVGLLSATAAACIALPPAVGGCPTGDGWSLVPAYTAAFQVNLPANGDFADQNGDFWACKKENRGTTGTTWKDNTSPLPGT